MIGTLKVNPDSPEAYSVELSSGETLQIGRKPSPGNVKKLILPYPEVSGQHAEIRCKTDGWSVVDSGSTNGTSINGTRLTPGKEYQLRNGDEIKIAQYALKVFPPCTEIDLSNGDEEEETQDRTQLSIKFMNATILVGDIKGFTTLMEKYRSEPEMVMKVAGNVFESLNKEINKNYGVLEKIAGDAIMAYWAADGSAGGSKVPAFQACLTALKLREHITAMGANQAMWPFPDHPLYLDIALATGPVASGSIGHASSNPSVLGDTANLVFRLEKLIGDDTPGDIIVDGATYNLTADKCQFTQLAQYNVKGKTATIDVFRLLSVKN